MTCARCGREQPPDQLYASFCTYCGGTLPAPEGPPTPPLRSPAPDLAALRPMSISDLLDRSFKLYKSHFATIVGTYMIFTGPLIVLNAISVILFNLAMPGMASPFAIWSEMLRHSGAPPPMPQQPVQLEYLALAYGVMGLAFLWNLLVLGWILGAVHWAAAAAHLGYRPTIRDAVRAASGRFWSLVGAWIVIYLSVVMSATVSCCLLGFPGLMLWTVLCLTLPVIVLEGQSVGTGLSRGYALVKPDYWRILLWSLLLVLFLFIALPVAVWALSMALAAVLMVLGAPNAGGVLSNVIYTILNGVVAPIFFIGFTLIYFDQRSRLEYFDVRYAAQALGLAPPGLPT